MTTRHAAVAATERRTVVAVFPDHRCATDAAGRLMREPIPLGEMVVMTRDGSTAPGPEAHVSLARIALIPPCVTSSGPEPASIGNRRDATPLARPIGGRPARRRCRRGRLSRSRAAVSPRAPPAARQSPNGASSRALRVGGSAAHTDPDGRTGSSARGGRGTWPRSTPGWRSGSWRRPTVPCRARWPGAGRAAPASRGDPAGAWGSSRPGWRRAPSRRPRWRS